MTRIGLINFLFSRKSIKAQKAASWLDQMTYRPFKGAHRGYWYRLPWNKKSIGKIFVLFLLFLPVYSHAATNVSCSSGANLLQGKYTRFYHRATTFRGEVNNVCTTHLSGSSDTCIDPTLVGKENYTDIKSGYHIYFYYADTGELLYSQKDENPDTTCFNPSSDGWETGRIVEVLRVPNGINFDTSNKGVNVFTNTTAPPIFTNFTDRCYGKDGVQFFISAEDECLDNIVNNYQLDAYVNGAYVGTDLNSFDGVRYIWVTNWTVWDSLIGRYVYDGGSLSMFTSASNDQIASALSALQESSLIQNPKTNSLIATGKYSLSFMSQKLLLVLGSGLGFFSKILNLILVLTIITIIVYFIYKGLKFTRH